MLRAREEVTKLAGKEVQIVNCLIIQVLDVEVNFVKVVISGVVSIYKDEVMPDLIILQVSVN